MLVLEQPIKDTCRGVAKKLGRPGRGFILYQPLDEPITFFWVRDGNTWDLRCPLLNKNGDCEAYLHSGHYPTLYKVKCPYQNQR